MRSIVLGAGLIGAASARRLAELSAYRQPTSEQGRGCTLQLFHSADAFADRFLLWRRHR